MDQPGPSPNVAEEGIVKPRSPFQTPTPDHSRSNSQQQQQHRQSVYLPLHTPSGASDGKFPFHSSAALGPPMSPLPPKSPSAIHPSYADVPLSVANAPEPPRLNHHAQQSPLSPRLGVPLQRKDSKPIYREDLPPMLAVLPPRLLAALDHPSAWLTYYFFANLGLTLYNKFVLVKFPFPWTMTGIHCLACTAGCLLFYQQGLFRPARISHRDQLTLLAFSALYALNIAISNVSLNLASVPFHQVVRASTPVFTILINVLALHKRYPANVVVSLAPVVLGVGLATYGDYYFTAWGFCLTVFGALLASLKGVATNLLLVGSLRLHPLDLLLRMSPLAFVQCVLYAWATGELAAVAEYGALEMTQGRAGSLALNGAIAFFLNVVSFSANKKTSALTMTVAGNVKQCLTIILAVWLFSVSVSFTNSIGILLTLLGGAWYARENWVARQQQPKPTLSPLVEVVMNEKSLAR